ncbi:hypothetical protein KR50_09560 [Jeotgalibacillus campisalis]|uniref:Uncharacterized protein n=2 Tax=Jeotgalibacillus campisalis TaxID=220754 RepID=A0A0C2RLG6_9BACL|nr:hypothetical protein KR50_09560 [Jeotgalibacillus campisalis]
MITITFGLVIIFVAILCGIFFYFEGYAEATVSNEKHQTTIDEVNNLSVEIENKKFLEKTEDELKERGYEHRGLILLLHSKNNKTLEVKKKSSAANTDNHQLKKDIEEIVNSIAEKNNLGTFLLKIN